MAKEDFVSRYGRDYPSATACFLDDFEACIAHLQMPKHAYGNPRDTAKIAVLEWRPEHESNVRPAP